MAARPLAGLEQNPPEIDIFFGSADEIEIDPQVEWIMVSVSHSRSTSISVAFSARKFPSFPPPRFKLVFSVGFSPNTAILTHDLDRSSLAMGFTKGIAIL